LYDEQQSKKEKLLLKETQIDSDFELLLQEVYINTVSERLVLYNKLSELKTEEELQTYEKELIDRFGPLPEPAVALLNSVRIKWIATKFGLEKMIMKKGKMVGYFIADQESKFYQSPNFNQVLQFVQQNPNLCKMKEKQTRNGLRLLLTFEQITSAKKALNVLEKIV
jgi:transcription-repair coupling factor (superfamily II helicase)